MGTSVFVNSVMKLFLLLSALIVVVMCQSQKPIHHRHHRHHHASLGLIMAGGGIYNPPNPTIYQTSVEMFLPETNTSCDLPPLPTGRAGLTLDVVQDVVVACGGDPTLQSCMMLVDGEWIEFYTTREIRRGFTSWVTPQGLRLLGAFIAPPSNFSETTELVPVRPWDEGGYSWKLAHPSQVLQHSSWRRTRHDGWRGPLQPCGQVLHGGRNNTHAGYDPGKNGTRLQLVLNQRKTDADSGRRI